MQFTMQDTPPHVARLKSTQGINIDVHYAIEEDGIFNARKMLRASHLKFVVHSPDLSPGADITAVLINRWEQNDLTTYQQVWHIKLKLIEDYEGSGPVSFIGSLWDSALVRNVGLDDLTIGEPQIAVVVDGVWQDDPIQRPGTHNFNFAWMLP